MTGEPYEVKGTSIKSKLEFVRENFGPDAEADLKRQFRSDGFQFILESEWYSYDLFEELCIAIADRHYGGDLNRLVEVGAYAAERNLAGTYSAYAEGKDFLGFLDRISILHDRFYNQGGMKVEVAGERACRIILEGAPRYADADLQVGAGFYVGAARFFGIEGVTHRIDRRTDRVIVSLSWK